MTAVDLKNLVIQFLEYDAAIPGLVNVDVSDSANDNILRAAIQPHLQEFTRIALSIFVPGATFNTVASQAVYNPGSASSPVFSVKYATRGDVELCGYDRAGVSGYEVARLHRMHQFDEGLPKTLVQVTEDQVILFPTPDSVYTITLTGFGYHPALSANNTVVQLPQSLEDAAVKFIAGRLLQRRASGDTKMRADALFGEGYARAVEYSYDVIRNLAMGSAVNQSSNEHADGHYV